MPAIPDLKETTKGKQDLSAFDHAISEALSKTCTPDFDYEGLILSHADSIIRTDTLVKQNTFTFSPDSQKNSVPVSLTAFISMLLDGPCFQEHVADGDEGHSSLGISQLIAYSTIKRRSEKQGSQRNNRARETPLPIYVALKVHAETRKRGLVDAFHGLVLCISYDRIWLYPLMLQTACVPGLSQKGLCVHNRL